MAERDAAGKRRLRNPRKSHAAVRDAVIVFVAFVVLASALTVPVTSRKRLVIPLPDPVDYSSPIDTHFWNGDEYAEST
jgi:hypothetical protein